MSEFDIKYWRYGSKPVDEHGNYVHIVGRRSGVWSHLMPLLRIDPAVKLLVGLDRVEFRQAKLSGATIEMVPLEQVCASFYGHHKPLLACELIVAAFGLPALGIALNIDVIIGLGMFITGLVLALLHYLRGTTLVLGVVEHSGRVHQFGFARSTIEGVDINEQQARQVNKVIQRLIDAKHKRMQLSAIGSAGG